MPPASAQRLSYLCAFGSNPIGDLLFNESGSHCVFFVSSAVSKSSGVKPGRLVHSKIQLVRCLLMSSLNVTHSPVDASPFVGLKTNESCIDFQWLPLRSFA